MRFSATILALLPLHTISHALCTDRHQHQLLEQPPLDLPFPKNTAEGTPDWRRLSNLDVVPLHPKARTGLVPPAVEEGLIFALGPRFANVFIEDAAKDRSQAPDLPCFIKCATTLLKLAPCIVIAVTTKNPVALLSCGLDKGAVCDCVNCLPDPVKNIIGGFCSSSSGLADTTISSEVLDYVDFIDYSRNDNYLQGWRGDVRVPDSTQVWHKPQNHEIDDSTATCSPCSLLTLQCCGVCAAGTCLGICC